VDVELPHGFQAGFESYQRNWDAVNSMRTRMMNMDQNIVPNVNTTAAGAYVDFNKSLSDRLRVGAGGRFDTANMYARSSTVNISLFQAYKGVSNLSRRDNNPSGNVRAAFGLTNSLELFAGAASTVRIPDAQERFYNHRRSGSDWVGDPALAPTRNSEANLGINLHRRGFYLKPLVF
jgi:iron complex outermembrane receptor protein